MGFFREIRVLKLSRVRKIKCLAFSLVFFLFSCFCEGQMYLAGFQLSKGFCQEVVVDFS